MKKKLLLSTAALLAGMSLASAQQMPGGQTSGQQRQQSTQTQSTQSHSSQFRAVPYAAAENRNCRPHLPPNRAIRASYVTSGQASSIAVATGSVEEVPLDGPEPLTGGVIDLGVIATEFLILAIDPYPRKPGAVFEAPDAPDDSDQPFAALAALKKPR